ncbi:MAG: UDP-N-acetylglucosamine 2-epimerase, partial [Candidatus Omnitrophota bacterium]
MNRRKGQIAVVFGTRPCIIKQAPVIRALVKHEIPFYIIHTGQHYTYNMERLFIKSLGLPKPRYHLSVGSGTHAVQTAEMIARAEKVLLADRPSAVLVQGDTNTALGAAIACSKLSGVRLGHVEAGLRSYDRSMPEEINRIL